jgi:hypothetical protein
LEKRAKHNEQTGTMTERADKGMQFLVRGYTLPPDTLHVGPDVCYYRIFDLCADTLILYMRVPPIHVTTFAKNLGAKHSSFPSGGDPCHARSHAEANLSCSNLPQKHAAQRPPRS